MHAPCRELTARRLIPSPSARPGELSEGIVPLDKSTHLAAPPHQVLPHIPHELRLQLLRAKLAADVQSPFLLCNFFIPWAEIKNWNAEVCERRPHQPPAIARSFQGPAIGTRTPVKRIRRRFRGNRVRQSISPALFSQTTQF